MEFYYPTYYVAAVVPVLFLNEDEYSFRNSSDYIKEEDLDNKDMDENKNIFDEIDEEYVNESTK